jgi:hypothetical protein
MDDASAAAMIRENTAVGRKREALSVEDIPPYVPNVALEPCKHCGRTFEPARLAVHERACLKARPQRSGRSTPHRLHRLDGGSATARGRRGEHEEFLSLLHSGSPARHHQPRGTGTGTGSPTRLVVRSPSPLSPPPLLLAHGATAPALVAGLAVDLAPRNSPRCLRMGESFPGTSASSYQTDGGGGGGGGGASPTDGGGDGCGGGGAGGAGRAIDAMTRSVGAARRLTAAQRHASEWQLIEHQGGAVAAGPWSRPLTRELHPHPHSSASGTAAASFPSAASMGGGAGALHPQRSDVRATALSSSPFWGAPKTPFSSSLSGATAAMTTAACGGLPDAGRTRSVHPSPHDPRAGR